MSDHDRSYSEELFTGWHQQFSVDEVLHEMRTDHQHLIIFRNDRFGRIMALDGIIQTTEADEFIYHEMMAHVPLFAHGNAARVLIVGGGDGGMLRETLRHPGVAHVTQVEIDQAVIDLCREYLPNHSAGAFDDPRLDLVIADGVEFVRDTDQRYDVIISDSTDPDGPGEALFTSQFYAGCKRCLLPGGILTTQNGVAFAQLDEVRTTARRIAPLFEDWTFYAAAVPTYVGGVMTFAWASDDPRRRTVGQEVLAERFAASGIETRYYTPAIHAAAFALPRYVEQAVDEALADK